MLIITSLIITVLLTGIICTKFPKSFFTETVGDPYGMAFLFCLILGVLDITTLAFGTHPVFLQDKVVATYKLTTFSPGVYYKNIDNDYYLNATNVNENSSYGSSISVISKSEIQINNTAEKPSLQMIEHDNVKTANNNFFGFMYKYSILNLPHFVDTTYSYVLNAPQ